MNIAEAKDQIKDTVDGYLTCDDTGAYIIPMAAQRPLFLLGAPGIGKTAVISQVASELGIGLVSYSMTHHTRQSALGLPFIVHREYGEESFDVSEYTMSEIIAAVYDYQEKTGHERGILFLDEINCVSETLYPSMLQFLQFKTFGRHKVPNGWVVVCAGNPPEYNKSVYEFDVVTLDRLRKIEVEPDLGAWMDYAHATGVHPAVTSYLEVKENHFYTVESTPGGKSFVTARGWDDLSRIIKLYESQGKTVNHALIEQFLQDEEISERFAQYYQLFTKYADDYRVAGILAGEPSIEVMARAQAARFDERLALVRLLLDAIESRLESVLETQQVTALVRDILRNHKEPLLAGAQVHAELDAAADELSAEAARQVQLELQTDAQVRPMRIAAKTLRGYCGACDEARTLAGPEAFETVQGVYGADVEAFRAHVEAASLEIDNAFQFLDTAFGEGREMMAFVAELTARPNTSQFISQFGNETYYAHNSSAIADGGRTSLLERIEALDLDAAAEEQACGLQRIGAGGMNCGTCSC